MARVFRFSSLFCQATVTQTRPVRVLEEVVRTGGVMNEKSGPFQRSDDFFFGLDGRKALAHLRESYFDLLFNRVIEQLDVIRCGQTVLA